MDRRAMESREGMVLCYSRTIFSDFFHVVVGGVVERGTDVIILPGTNVEFLPAEESYMPVAEVLAGRRALWDGEKFYLADSDTIRPFPAGYLESGAKLRILGSGLS